MGSKSEAANIGSGRLGYPSIHYGKDPLAIKKSALWNALLGNVQDHQSALKFPDERTMSSVIFCDSNRHTGQGC